MRLTTKGRFAVMAMIDLARHQKNGPVSLAGISERQDISVAYLEQLFSKLRRGNLVKSVRGPGGGYLLSGNAGDITIADIVFAVDEPLDVTRCGGNGNCAKGSVKCVTHNLWASLNERIIDYLESVLLSDLSEMDSALLSNGQNSKKLAFSAKPAK
ncbi:Rrf2 family transcriptional regulator [Oxalobacter paraformigenes]|uniref:Iron-sulfur cluster assembly transcription factor IscR n=1 Tax=Oxalobacter paraformigenes TaxID=556268 RepID=C3X6S4_9BURK|nr:Rrf2 family transcriptional regulator [Oxalobacter paraformigenes]EEO28910.1 iron-sulfur cluster assembly transcription factor IscR [Oxalobacter paraformigenes]